MAQWWYVHEGNVVGPVEAVELRARLGQGELGPDTLVWTPAWTQWRSLKDAGTQGHTPAPPPLPTHAVSPSPPPSSSPPSEDVAQFEWRRFFARFFDLSWESFVAGIFLMLLGPILIWNNLLPREVVWRWTQGDLAGVWRWLVAPVLLTPLALLLDAWVYRIWGITPGKKLLGLTVLDASGTPLSADLYARRNVEVWAAGLGLGLPLVSMVCYVRQFVRLCENLPASYDEQADYQVRGNRLTLGTGAVFLCCSAALLAVLSFVQGAMTPNHPPRYAATTSEQPEAQP